jgi:lipopolysaccharide/colanic/teichoic acid biosynthesis glycosyltransferase
MKLDELPSLWNVVKGEMSLVGPRPEVPRYVDLNNSLWRMVLKARPGITDPVTLRLRNEEALLAEIQGDREHFYLEALGPFKLRYYLEYLQVRSWWTDILVLWKTAIAVLAPHRAPLPTMEEILLYANGKERG